MKFTVMKEEPGREPVLRHIFPLREMARSSMAQLFEDDLRFDGLSDEEIREALDAVSGDYIDAEDWLGFGHTYRVMLIAGG